MHCQTNISLCLTGSGSSSSNDRGSTYPHCLLQLTHAHAHFRTSVRLDRKVKELAQEKEELLKSSKSQAATTENVKVQIETLLKVALAFLSCPKPLIHHCPPDRVRNRQEGRRACPCRHEHIPRLALAGLTFRSSVCCLIRSVFFRSCRIIHCGVP